MSWFDKQEWWHILRGHGKPKGVEFDPFEIERQMTSLGYDRLTIHKFITNTVWMVTIRCACGAEWVFSGVSMETHYFPDGSPLFEFKDQHQVKGRLQ